MENATEYAAASHHHEDVCAVLSALGSEKRPLVVARARDLCQGFGTRLLQDAPTD